MTKVPQDSLSDANGKRQQHFNQIMHEVMFKCTNKDPNYPLQNYVIKACKYFLSSLDIDNEARKRNSSYIASEFRNLFSTKYSRKPLINIFEQISIYFDLSDDEKKETYSILKGFNIKCSNKCLKSFIPQLNKKQKELNETGFYVVDKNPNSKNVVLYSKRVLNNSFVTAEGYRRILYFLNKHRTIYGNKICKPTLFGQNVFDISSSHKPIITEMLDFYKKKHVNENFLYALVSQTNFSDEEGAQIENDFEGNEKFVKAAICKRRALDIKRLNNYIISVDKKDKSDAFKMASHKSVFVEMAYASLVEGRDVNDIDFNKAYLHQLSHLKAMHKNQCGQEDNDLFVSGAWEESKKNILENIFKADAIKIDAINQKIEASSYIMHASLDAVTFKRNVSSLRGNDNSFKYSIYGVINHFER